MAGQSPAAFSGTSVLAASGVDVGADRESARRRRLWTLAVLMAVPAGYLWYRLADGRPFNVFALPEVDWVVVALIAGGSVIGGLLGATVGRRLPQLALRLFIVAVGATALVTFLVTS